MLTEEQKKWVKVKTHYSISQKTESEIAFGVYRRYLENFSLYMEAVYSNLEGLAKELNTKFSKLQADSKLDNNYIKRFLFISWNTEYLAENEQYNDIELTRVNNQWKPIQVYYSIYALAEAAIYAVNQKAGSHSSCLNLISEYLVNKKIYPWCYAYFGYKGNKSHTSTLNQINFGANTRVANSLEGNKATPPEIIACCLRAEHLNRIQDVDLGKGKNKILRYKYNPNYTTIFHFLYRLRIKSNYKDVEIFLAEAPDNEIKSFSNCLREINDYTNVLLEMLIIKKIGKNNFIGIIDEYCKKNKNAECLQRRKIMYLSL